VPTATSLIFFYSKSILSVDIIGMLATLCGSLFLISNSNTEEDIPRIPYYIIGCIMFFHALVDILNPYLKTILFYNNTFNSFYYNLFKWIVYCAIISNLIKLKANLKDYIIQSFVSIFFMLLFIFTPLSKFDSSLYYLVLYAIFHEVSGYMSLLLCSKIDDSYSYYNYISRNIRLALYIVNYLILLAIT
jgi:hypothetical protein